ncbi:MAG: rod shape-determining protein RodA [Dehalococcoidia bacterium]
MLALSFRHFDLWLLLAGVALAAYGALLIYSGSLTSYPEGIQGLSHPAVRHAAFAALGILIILLVARVDYRRYGQVALPLYAIGLVLLAAVLLVGETTFGSRRWLNLGGLVIQASEVAKLLTILALAKYLADRVEEVARLAVFVMSLAIVLLPALLVLVEPDLGTAVIFGAIWLGMVAIAGARLRHILILLAVGILATPFVVLGVMGDYQRERLATFINPTHDPLGAGFATLQGEISIGSGGLLGKGFTNGTQTQLHYLQTPTTDYIFSVLGEELGFVGALLLFALFVFLLLRGLRVAALARDPYGRLVATGIVIMILAQVFINIGVNIRLLPVTGIPLPFISQGNSSLLTLFVSLGILQSILARHRRMDF